MPLQLSGVTVAEAVSFIVEALRDPHNPRWCGLGVMSCFVVIRSHHENVGDVVKQNHSLGSTIMTFLTAKRSIADIESLDAVWAVCRCSQAEIKSNDIATAVHVIVSHIGSHLSTHCFDLNRNRPFGRFGNKADTTASIFHNLVCFLDNALRLAKPFSVAQGRHPEFWPATPNDLIPFGPETTVESLVVISRIMGSSDIFRILAEFLRICGPLIIPALVSSPTAAEYFAEHGLEICSAASNAPLTHAGHLDDATGIRFLSEVMDLLSIIMHLLALPPHLNRDFQHGHAQKSFEFLTQVISILHSSVIPPEWKQSMTAPACGGFAKYAAALYTICMEEMSVPRHRVHPYIRAVIDYIAEPQSPAELALLMLRFAKTQQFCFAAGCTESAQSSGRVYMRCSGCGIVAYSSKQCQRRAWTDKQLPHRAICKKMKQVVDAAGGNLHKSSDVFKFSRDMKRANVSDSVLTEVGEWLSSVTELLQRKDPLGSEPHHYSVGTLTRLNCVKVII